MLQLATESFDIPLFFPEMNSRETEPVIDPVDSNDLSFMLGLFDEFDNSTFSNLSSFNPFDVSSFFPTSSLNFVVFPFIVFSTPLIYHPLPLLHSRRMNVNSPVYFVYKVYPNRTCGRLHTS